jgi:hypothetical protein
MPKCRNNVYWLEQRLALRSFQDELTRAWRLRQFRISAVDVENTGEGKVIEPPYVFFASGGQASNATEAKGGCLRRSSSVFICRVTPKVYKNLDEDTDEMLLGYGSNLSQGHA